MLVRGSVSQRCRGRSGAFGVGGLAPVGGVFRHGGRKWVCWCLLYCSGARYFEVMPEGVVVWQVFDELGHFSRIGGIEGEAVDRAA